MPGAIPISAGGSGGSSPRASTESASSYGELRRQEAVSAKRLYAVDARCTADSPVTEVSELTGIAAAAVAAGDGHVLDVSHVIFPNRAITLVLILAESHLSIHTWPEENLIAIDLFSCGAIDGQRVLDELVAALRLTDVRVAQLDRGSPRVLPGHVP
jgi:S-adenosylmethionine decarboxylase